MTAPAPPRKPRTTPNVPNAGMPAGYATAVVAARKLGVAPSTLRKWVRQGRFASHRHPVTGIRVFRLADVEAFNRRLEESRTE